MARKLTPRPSRYARPPLPWGEGSMKGDVKGNISPWTRQPGFSRRPAPVCFRTEFVTQAGTCIAVARRRGRFPMGLAAVVRARCANQGSIGDSRPMAFLGCARGHSVAQRRFLASQRNSPSPLLDTLPRRPILLPGSAKPWPSKRTATAARRAKSWAWGGSLRALNRCRFQMLDVVAFSFLPKVQGDGGELAGHRQAN